MADLVLSGNTSGAITISAPSVAGTNTITLPAVTDTLAGIAATQTLTNKTLSSPTFTGTASGTVLVSGTNTASTSGTSIDFTGLPSWIKRITVMFNGVSTSGSSSFLIQLGTGSTTFTTTGYSSYGFSSGSSSIVANTSTIGLVLGNGITSTSVYGGNFIIANVTGNTWSGNGMVGSGSSTSNGQASGAGFIALGATLTAVRITTVNGTDTFDAGSINILYE